MKSVCVCRSGRGDLQDGSFPAGMLSESAAVIPHSTFASASTDAFAFPWTRAEFPREFSLGSLRGIRGYCEEIHFSCLQALRELRLPQDDGSAKFSLGDQINRDYRKVAVYLSKEKNIKFLLPPSELIVN